jgi:hypothetical protein
MAVRLAINVPRDVRRRLAHWEAGDSAYELDHLASARYRGARLAQRLAVFAGDEPCQLVGLIGQPIAESEQDLHPLDDGRLRSGRQGVRSGPDGLIDVLRRLEGYTSESPAGRGIEDRAAAI